MALPRRAALLLALPLAACLGTIGGGAGGGPDAGTPAGDGAPSRPDDLATGGEDAAPPGDGGASVPVHTIKLSMSLYCPRMSTLTAQLFYANDAAVTSSYDAWLSGLKSGGGAYAAGPLDILGTRVRSGEQGGGSTLTAQQLENMKISCGRINAKAGPGAFETTTLAPDPAGRPVCLLQGMDWGTDFHYAGASFAMRAACLGAPTGFAWTKHFDNDAFPGALASPSGGVGAWAVGDRTYVTGYSTAIWAYDGSTPVGQRADKSTTYAMTLTATNAAGSATTAPLKYRFVNIGDVVNGGFGGVQRHPADATCRIKSAGQAGNNVEGQVAYTSGDAWAFRVMLIEKPGGGPMPFQWVLWGETEFAIGQGVPPYAVISDLPCEFDQIVDGCYSDSVVISYYPGSPVYTTDRAAAKAMGQRYCGLRPGQIYYMNVRSRGWLSATPADGCPAGQTCTFAAFLKAQ